MATVTTKKPAPKKAGEPKDDGTHVLGYNVKEKCKQIMIDPVISRTSRGGYMAKGTNEEGAVLTAIMGKDKAEAALEAEIATKDVKSWKTFEATQKKK